jgi:hypothetical protein
MVTDSHRRAAAIPPKWWADPVAGHVLVFYAVREVRAILTGQH